MFVLSFNLNWSVKRFAKNLYNFQLIMRTHFNIKLRLKNVMVDMILLNDSVIFPVYDILPIHTFKVSYVFRMGK